MALLPHLIAAITCIAQQQQDNAARQNDDYFTHKLFTDCILDIIPCNLNLLNTYLLLLRLPFTQPDSGLSRNRLNRGTVLR